nr:MAG TPA: hypothetical protein [Caudoviricetes sp.]
MGRPVRPGEGIRRQGGRRLHHRHGEHLRAQG